MLPIRIMTRDFQLLGEVDNYSSLQITRSWSGIGMLELRINRYLKDADKLNRDCIVFPHNHFNKAFVIKHKEIELDEKGKQTENWVIRAPSLKSWFSDVLTMPPDGYAYDAIKDNAESVLHHYVQSQALPHGLPIVLGDNLNRGDQVDWQSRFKVLSDELKEISLISGVGWGIDIDVLNKQFVFNTSAGRNLTVHQSDNPPAIFSPEFGTLKSLSYLESELDYKNVAVVARRGR